MADPLSGCWAKLDRAKTHIDVLRAAILEVSGADLNSVPLRRQYEPEEGAIVWRIERAPEIRPAWGLIVGDALHNIRGALDHLWWQLATLHLGREPSEDEAKDIQFPIYTELTTPWLKRRFLKHVDPALAAYVEPLQPYHAKPGEILALGALTTLSNTDKHRVVHVVARPAARLTFRYVLGPDDFHNCVPDPARRDLEIEALGDRPLKARDVVLRAYIQPTAPNPDVNVDPHLTAHVTLEPKLDLFPALDAMWTEASRIITLYAPYLEGPSMGHT